MGKQYSLCNRKHGLTKVMYSVLILLTLGVFTIFIGFNTFVPSAQAQTAPEEKWVQVESGTKNNLNGVTWNGNKFVAVGRCEVIDGYRQGATILTSYDGVSWSKQTSGIIRNLKGVTWGKNEFVAVGEENAILTSPDGVNWTRQHLRGSPRSFWPSLNDVIWNGNKYVAVGIDQIIFTSPDGVSWTEQDSGTTDLRGHFYGVTWSGDQFITFGYIAMLHTSPDGVKWTRHASQPFRQLKDVTWDGDKFVGVGGVGDIFFTSSDGVKWTSHGSSGTNTNLNGVTWNGDQFVTVGSSIYGGGMIFTSPDGVNWTESNSGTRSFLNDIAWNGSQFVVVGNGGTILTSSLFGDDPSHGDPEGPGDDEYTGKQPTLLAPWVGTKALSQGNNDKFSHHRDSSRRPHVWHNHYAIDVVMQTGSPVLSATNGKVDVVRYGDSPGLFIAIESYGPQGDEYRITYRHLSKTFVKKGDHVKKGDVIAYSGNSGNSTDPHLHFIIGKQG